MSKAAIEFLKQHGHRSLVSLGSGHLLNRVDNHLRLFAGLRLDYYVAIDRLTRIEYNPSFIFSDKEKSHQVLASRFGRFPEQFFECIRTFPGTSVEELANIECGVVVCQRVLPFRHWEDVIASMNPLLILQEDLRGCELQGINRAQYTKTRPGIAHYRLQPFRRGPLIPGEKNIVLWRRKDFFTCPQEKLPWWKRLLRVS